MDLKADSARGKSRCHWQERESRLTINAHTGCFIWTPLLNSVNYQTSVWAEAGVSADTWQLETHLTQYQPRQALRSASRCEVRAVKKENTSESVLKSTTKAASITHSLIFCSKATNRKPRLTTCADNVRVVRCRFSSQYDEMAFLMNLNIKPVWVIWQFYSSRHNSMHVQT